MSRKQSKRRREAVRVERAAAHAASVAARADAAPRAAARAENRETRAWASALVAGLSALVPEEAIRRLLRDEEEANRAAFDAAREAENAAASRRGRLGAAVKAAKKAAAEAAEAEAAAEAAVEAAEAARTVLVEIGGSPLIYTRAGAERFDDAAARLAEAEAAARASIRAAEAAREAEAEAARAADAVRQEGARAASRRTRLAARAAAATLRRRDREEERARLLPAFHAASGAWDAATRRVAFAGDAREEVMAAEEALAAWGRLSALRDGPARAVEGLCDGTARRELEAVVRRLQREATRGLGRGTVPGYRNETDWLRGLRPLDRSNRA